MTRLIQTLQIQRWDDHRYYHHSRINQALHLGSALSFLTAYVYLFIDPVVATDVVTVPASAGMRAVIGAGGLEQRDGFGHGAALGGSSALQQSLLNLCRCKRAHRMSKLRPSGRR